MSRILGIDPGLRLSGWAVVERGGGAPGRRRSGALVEAGVIRLDPKASVEDRLVQVHDELSALIDETSPTVVAIEKLYAHYKHPRTAIVMGHARGVILLAARQRGLSVEHLPATEVKKSICGNGHASKEQVQRSVQAVCGLDTPPTPPDVADAIAIALACAERITHVNL